MHPRRQHRSHPVYQRQQGAALLISLIVLGALTLLGLSSLGAARFDTIMSRNAQFQLEALSNAELVLSGAETEIDALVTDDVAVDFSIEGDHYYFPTLYTAPDNSQREWDFSARTTDDGRYIVEYWGSRPVPGESSRMGSAIEGSRVHVFQLTTQSDSGKGARRAVQSIYLAPSAP